MKQQTILIIFWWLGYWQHRKSVHFLYQRQSRAGSIMQDGLRRVRITWWKYKSNTGIQAPWIDLCFDAWSSPGGVSPEMCNWKDRNTKSTNNSEEMMLFGSVVYLHMWMELLAFRFFTFIIWLRMRHKQVVTYQVIHILLWFGNVELSLVFDKEFESQVVLGGIKLVGLFNEGKKRERGLPGSQNLFWI